MSHDYRMKDRVKLTNPEYVECVGEITGTVIGLCAGAVMVHWNTTDADIPDWVLTRDIEPIALH